MSRRRPGPELARRPERARCPLGSDAAVPAPARWCLRHRRVGRTVLYILLLTRLCASVIQ